MKWHDIHKPVPEDESKAMPWIWLIVLFMAFMYIVMYTLGKEDGREDALKSNVVNCATVEVLEDN